MTPPRADDVAWRPSTCLARMSGFDWQAAPACPFFSSVFGSFFQPLRHMPNFICLSPLCAHYFLPPFLLTTESSGRIQSSNAHKILFPSLLATLFTPSQETGGTMAPVQSNSPWQAFQDQNRYPVSDSIMFRLHEAPFASWDADETVMSLHCIQGAPRSLAHSLERQPDTKARDGTKG